MNLFRTQPVTAQPHVDAGEVHGGIEGEATLKRVLTARHLVMLGIGAVIGAGIFVLTGNAAANHAGPAVVLSLRDGGRRLRASRGCATPSSRRCCRCPAAPIPIRTPRSANSSPGSSAGTWCWNTLFAAATVAVGWSGYFSGLVESIGHALGMPLSLPAALTSAPLNIVDGQPVLTGAIINLPAVAIVVAVAWLCYLGISQSATANAIVVAIKVGVILLFMAFTLQYVNPDNWIPFIPEPEGPGRFGFDGVVRGAGVVFFAYIGFDAVSTAAQEAKNPQRDMPIGILGSLAICTLIYIAMSAIMTGIMPYHAARHAAPGRDRARALPGPAVAQVAGRDRRDRGPDLRDPGDGARAAAHLLLRCRATG